MKPKNYSRVLLNSSALTAVILAWTASSAQAANKAWSTTAANGNFSGTNWTVGIAGTTPPTDAAASLDALFFDTSATTTLNNDLVGATLAGLTFNSGASAFTIGGTAFTLSAAITNNSTSLQTINNNLTLAATQTVTTNTGGVTLGGALSGAGGLTKTGTGTLTLSAANSFTGALTLQAGTTNITANTTNIGTGQVFVGNVASTAARLNLSGSSTLTTATTAFTNYVGGATSSVGVINIASGSTFASTATTTTAGGNIGGSTNSAGAIYNAGTLTQNATAAGGAGFFLGNAANAYGYLRSSGTANISARVGLGQGTGGAGVVDINGGTTTVGGTNQTATNTAIQINSGNTGSGSVSALNVTNGGSLLVTKTGNQTYRTNNGSNQYASINIDGVGSVYNTASGLAAANALSGIDLGQNNLATNTTTLTVSNSGVLATNYVFKAGALATGILNFNGGTLRATGTVDVNGLIQTSIATVIHSNGATVDTNGNNATINGVLVSPTGNGVTGVTLGGTLTGYVGAPLVKFSGDGTGAAGYATFDPATGTITGITITSPGSGYTTAPTVTLLGGSGTVATGAGAGAATATASIGAVAGGSLTKIGSGSLTLAAVNTYTGVTNVTGGTLTLNATGSVNNSSGIVINGSGAKFLQTSATAPTPAITVTQGTLDGTGTVDTATFASSSANILTHGNGGTATLTVNNLTFNDAATINLNTPSTTFAKIATTTLTTGAANGAGKVTINASNATWAPGDYQLISYTTLGGIGFSEFQKGIITGLTGRQSATLTDSPGVIALTIAGDNPVWTGALNGDWTTATLGNPKNWALITSLTPTDYINGDVVVFDDSATSSTVNISNGNVSPTTTTFDNSGVEIGGRDYEITGTSGIVAGSVTLNGFGPVTLSTANTYPGGTNLNKGTLKINNSSAIGAGTLTIAGTGSSRIDTAGSAITLTTNNAQNWNSDFTFVGSNDLNLGTGAVTFGGNRTVTTDGSSTLTVGGSIVGGGFSLTKAGTGTLALAGTSSIGNLKVSAGLLKVSAGTLNVAENSGANTLLSTGGNIEVSGGALNISGVGGWFPIGDTNGQTSTFTVSGGTVSITNNFGTEVGRLGAGVLTITSGSYSTTDTAGVGLIVGDNQTGAAGVGTVNLNGGFLAANKITSFTTNPNKLYLNGGVLKPTATNATWFPATTNLSTEVRNGGAIIDTNGFDVTMAEILTHSAFGGDSAIDGGLTKNGIGTLVLSGANTYTGSTTVNGGILSLATAYLSDSAAVVVGTNGVLNLTHNSTDQVGSLTINGVLKLDGVYDSTNSGGFITGTGKLRVGSSGYTAWADTNAGGQASNLDYDNDGVKNGVEYFMGQTGSTFTANPGIVNGKVTWPKDPAFSGSFKVETSPDLAVWTDLTATPAVDLSDSAFVKYTVPTGSGKLFIRLDVTPN